MSNIMHLLMHSAVFNIPLVLPRIRKLAWQCSAKPWVLDECGPWCWRQVLGPAGMVSCEACGTWSLETWCAPGTEMP